MKKEVLVFIFDGFADWESAYICAELNGGNTGYTVKTVSMDQRPKTSMGGLRIEPDYSLSNFPPDFALLILPGGVAWMDGRNDSVLPLTQYAAGKGIPIAAICNATNYMAKNGFLDRVKHTGNTLEVMKQYAPHYRGEANFIERQAVTDSGIITANGTAALEFAREILLLLRVKPETDVLEWYAFNKSGFYSS